MPQLLAVSHSVGEHMGVPQQVVGLDDLALGQQVADLGGMNLNAVQLHHADNLAANAQLLAFLLQPLRIAQPFVAKVIVIAGNDAHGAQLLVQVFLHELIPGLMLHFAVEFRQNDFFDPVIMLHQPDAVLVGVDHGHRLAGDCGRRMAVEGHDAGDGAQPSRFRHCRLHQGCVSHMYPVKKAQGNDSLFPIAHCQHLFILMIPLLKSF